MYKKIINYIKSIWKEPVDKIKESERNIEFQVKVMRAHTRDKFLILYSDTLQKDGLRRWTLIRECYYENFGSAPYYINASRSTAKQAKEYASTFKRIEDITEHKRRQKSIESKYKQRVKKFKNKKKK